MNDVLAGYTEAPYLLLRSRASVALFRGCYAPETSVAPCSIRPFGDGLRGGFLDLENGAIWPLNGLRAKKFHVFRIKGLDTDPWGGRVNARNEKTVLADGFFQVSQS